VQARCCTASAAHGMLLEMFDAADHAFLGNLPRA
jgi:hypothetical protein